MPPGTMRYGEVEERHDEYNDGELKESDFGLRTKLRGRRCRGRPWSLGIKCLIGVAFTCQPEYYVRWDCVLGGCVLTSVGCKNAQMHAVMEASGSMTQRKYIVVMRWERIGRHRYLNILVVGESNLSSCCGSWSSSLHIMRRLSRCSKLNSF